MVAPWYVITRGQGSLGSCGDEVLVVALADCAGDVVGGVCAKQKLGDPRLTLKNKKCRKKLHRTAAFHTAAPSQLENRTAGTGPAVVLSFLVIRVCIVDGQLFTDAVDQRAGNVIGAVRQLRERCIDRYCIARVVQKRLDVQSLQLFILLVDRECDGVALLDIVLDDQVRSSSSRLQRYVACLLGLDQCVRIPRGVLLGQRADLLSVLLELLFLF